MFMDTVTVKNKTGLHARPAADLANTCKQYKSDIEIVCGDKIINPKSVISLLAGGVKQNARVEVRVTGEDEDRAGPAVVEFIRHLEE